MEQHDYFELQEVVLGNPSKMVSDDTLTEKIKKLFEDRKELFVSKNQNYGNSWVKTGEILSLIFKENGIHLKTREDFIGFGVIVRMLDKYVRYCNLKYAGEEDKVGESICDTVGDLGVYALMLSAFDKGE
jgi:hypothetical protein